MFLLTFESDISLDLSQSKGEFICNLNKSLQLFQLLEFEENICFMLSKIVQISFHVQIA